eukprot:TCONS_00020328-protein
MMSKRRQIISALALSLFDDNEMEILREEPSTSKKRMVMATTAAFSEMLPGCCTREKYSKHKEFIPFIDTYHPNTFTAMFRMTRSTFDTLLGAICMDETFLKQNSGGMYV